MMASTAGVFCVWLSRVSTELFPGIFAQVKAEQM